MNRSKKVFIAIAILFVAVMAYFGYDVSSRTTFPGSKPQLKERIKKQFLTKDSTKSISIQPNR
ncbi:MAG: hypothetical protein ACKO96_03265 [Flammeovirgaceae bacterium]